MAKSTWQEVFHCNTSGALYGFEARTAKTSGSPKVMVGDAISIEITGTASDGNGVALTEGDGLACGESDGDGETDGKGDGL